MSNKIRMGATEFYNAVEQIAQNIITSGKQYSWIYGIPSGGVPFAIALNQLLRKKGMDTFVVDAPQNTSTTLIVDDVVDSGSTIHPFIKSGYNTASLHIKTNTPSTRIPTHYYQQRSEWIVYWWEKSEEASISDSVVRQLQYIGEDVTREGLKETPTRVIKSYKELYSGYQEDVASVFKTFVDGSCDEMVILKDIEMCSMCEHHMLPFFGKAHIAYIPDGKVIGISKLARLLEIFARRLQIQERIGSQITDALNMYLKPKGAACVIEAQHFCMKGRGVKKQNSVMVTSSLTGAFRTNADSRAELMSIIK